MNSEEISYITVFIDDDFWNSLLKMNSTQAIQHQYNMLTETKCFDNFKIAAGLLEDNFREGFFFSDSDAYKWLDAASRILKHNYSDLLKKQVENFIDLIEKAMDEDGYIFTFNQIHFKENRWKNLWIEHELYCLGHLIEGLLSYDSDKSIKLAQKIGNLITSRFLDSKSSELPGHQEIEIALLKLYKKTQNDEYLEMTYKFIEKRGKSKLIWLKFLKNALSTSLRMRKVNKLKVKYNKLHPESKAFSLPENVQISSPKGMKKRSLTNFASGKYIQNHKPLVKQDTSEGHSVRFSYLVTAAAMYSNIAKNTLYKKALEGIWDNMVKKRMFITGGIGSFPVIEGFGNDYELNPEYAYCETCAAIGSILWNWEMTLLTSNSKYADLLEWQLYNAANVGMGINGDRYFYRNPLVSPQHYERKEWYKIPCCPSNISRLWASIGKYIYSHTDEELYIHQYIGSTSEIIFNEDKKVNISIKSFLPWEGNIQITINPIIDFGFKLKLRIPSWTTSPKVILNNNTEHFPNSIVSEENTASGYSLTSRYIEIDRKWHKDDVIYITFPLSINLSKQDKNVHHPFGKFTLTRGPLVYCLESVDNPDLNIFDEILDKETFTISKEFFCEKEIYLIHGTTISGNKLKAIPYFLWGNRGSSSMTTKIHVKNEY